MVLVLVYLPAFYASLIFPCHTPDYPRLDLPKADIAETGHFHSHIDVSLDSNQRWSIGGMGRVSEESLAAFVKLEADHSTNLGYPPRLRVRIAADQPARHFKRLHQIATDAGIEDFAFATLP